MKKLIITLCLYQLCYVNHGQVQPSANDAQPFASILYTAVVKGKVALPCDVTAPTSDDSVALVLWYKDDALAPIYTIDARKGTIEQARTLTSPSLEGRAYFNLHNRPAFLQIDPIKLMDAGVYRCRVDFKKARTLNTVISLKVIVPPEEPIITDVQGNELRGLIGPYNEGDELRLVCVTVGGKPRPSLTWWRDDNIIDDSFDYNDKDVTSNQLMITSLARHNLLSIFTCQAINNNITLPSTTSITLDLNMKPTEVHITQLTSVLVADREVSFECNTFGSRPKAILYWFFDGQRFSTPLNGDHQTSTTITLTLKQIHNNAILICTAENPKIPGSTITDNLKLDVHYVPRLSLRLGSPTISLTTLQEGNDIYFDCEIDANPHINRPIIWRFNSDILHSQHGVIQSNQTLVLQRVSRKQSGTYQCEAGNNQGAALSNTINLTIRYAPFCRNENILVYGVALHETIHLECDVDANPSRVSFQWKHQYNSELLQFNQVNDTRSTLSFSPHEPNDYGKIDCIAKNEVGLQQRACTFHITSSDPPNLSFRCRIANQSDESLMVHCLPDVRVNYTQEEVKQGEDNYNPSRGLFIYPASFFTCQVFRKNEPYPIANVSKPLNVPYQVHSYEINLMHNNEIKFLINNLTPETSYRIKCFSLHSRGSSQVMWLSGETSQPAQKLIGNGRSNLLTVNGRNIFTGKPMLMALLLGIIVVTLILVSLGIIAIIRVRRTHRHVIGLTRSDLDNSQVGPAGGTMFDEGEEVCCCDDECCDEMLLTTTTVQQQEQRANQFNSVEASKGPPDIIPSIGYCTPNNNFDCDKSKDEDKFISSYDKFGMDKCITMEPISIVRNASSQSTLERKSSTLEYKKEMAKGTRVDLIGGSPKFESTV
ncbi:hemicentin-2-like isoform X2 [Tetranychus urticae]|uniref:hemicentin-2-like isoform X2 n=1 Tax=Tetranychus urticae TaxID=32264 RepID=UPI00077BAD7E|nr:hemicentin-2-like isoform X2 [Tetranychus urticae]